MTKRKTQRAIAFLGNYLPRKCGIATFTTDICESTAKHVGNSRNVFSIAMTDRPEGYNYPERVKFEIRAKILNDYEQAADYINLSKVDLVCVQHEFGIFGGRYGGYLLSFLRKLKVPVVTTLHTVLENFSDSDHFDVFDELVHQSDKLVVLSKKSIDILTSHNYPRDKFVYIPHGIPDLKTTQSKTLKEQFDLADKTIILTFGLLSPVKGIEYMIQAMPKIVERFPNTVYLILGATHPDIIKHHGEEYRQRLIRLVEKLGLTKNVFFHNKFVELDELCDYLKAADIYVIPYLNKEQIISGTMAYALGAGKAVISTPSWSAEEILSEGRGILVPFKDSDSFSNEVLNLLTNKSACNNIKKLAYEYGRKMIWPEVARQYVELFDYISEIERPAVVSGFWESKAPVLSTINFPVPILDHLKVLTDDFALYQHATFTVPDYNHGYCVDDNARALVVVTKYYRLFDEPEALDLFRKYLAFLLYAQLPDGKFRNFFSIDRRPWENDIRTDDCFGRALWGLGYVIANSPDFFWTVAKNAFEKALAHIETIQHERGWALSIHGLYYYLKRYPGALHIKNHLKSLADKIVGKYEKYSTDNWQWFDEHLTYCNGLLPLSLWISSEVLADKTYQIIAEKTTDFLVNKCTKDGHISLVGNEGWLHKTSEYKAEFDQQPIDAMWLVELGKAAYNVTNNSQYLELMQNSCNWFLGDNDTGDVIYDHVTGGCYDGLMPIQQNLNQGAESTLSGLLALLDITEMTRKETMILDKIKTT